jgi:glucose-6-phosphate 1-dehydrogenase
MLSLMNDDSCTPNTLTICIQPDEGIHLNFQAKQPDSSHETRDVDMEFSYRRSFGEQQIPEAYERLLLDAINGDAALFTRSDEIETLWGLIDPILKPSPGSPPIGSYARGSWGPKEAEDLLARDGHIWRLGCRPDGTE